MIEIEIEIELISCFLFAIIFVSLSCPNTFTIIIKITISSKAEHSDVVGFKGVKFKSSARAFYRPTA